MHRLSMAAIVAASMGMAGACAAQSQTGEDLDVTVEPGEGHHVYAYSFGGHGLSDLDRDGDGKVSREEFMAERAEDFDEFDENKDGYIEDEEFESFVERKVDRAMRRVKLRTEHKMAQLSERLNELGDRLQLRLGDLEHMKLDLGPAFSGFRFRFDGPDSAEMIKRLDKNGDGTLSREEFEARPKDPFDFLDKNGDGELSEEELENAPGHFMPRPFIYRFGEFDGDDDN